MLFLLPQLTPSPPPSSLAHITSSFPSSSQISFLPQVSLYFQLTPPKNSSSPKSLPLLSLHFLLYSQLSLIPPQFPSSTSSLPLFLPLQLTFLLAAQL